mmetsp:Transcript_13776/g.28245  ORF Transcript_13776/g.28245 Transcript_13776/m.28245 type:complete len:367 (-) Transcript_13776:35-1135(-)
MAALVAFGRLKPFQVVAGQVHSLKPQLHGQGVGALSGQARPSLLPHAHELPRRVRAEHGFLHLRHRRVHRWYGEKGSGRGGRGRGRGRCWVVGGLEATATTAARVPTRPNAAAFFCDVAAADVVGIGCVVVVSIVDVGVVGGATPLLLQPPPSQLHLSSRWIFESRCAGAVANSNHFVLVPFRCTVFEHAFVPRRESPLQRFLRSPHLRARFQVAPNSILPVFPRLRGPFVASRLGKELRERRLDAVLVASGGVCPPALKGRRVARRGQVSHGAANGIGPALPPSQSPALGAKELACLSHCFPHEASHHTPFHGTHDVVTALLFILLRLAPIFVVLCRSLVLRRCQHRCPRHRPPFGAGRKCWHSL